MSTQEAVDTILGIFKAAWDPNVAVYDDLPSSAPAGEVTWARATIRHANGNQATLSNDAGSRVYTDEGLVTIQVFSPVGDGSTANRTAAETVLNAYRDARVPNVWFRNQQLKEVGSDGAFYQTNVTSIFSYDTVR